MIVNNHETMSWIEEELKDQKLSVDLLFDLHRKVTKGTIDDAHQGKLRETLNADGQPLVIKPWDDTVIAYVTPKREFVEQQLPTLVAFANDEQKGKFIHPLTKGIMLHFWVGLLHPFEDGNGRLARILFYWYMLRRKYWSFSYLSISERILKSAKQYAMAYIYTEQDDFDLNYFIQYNVEKITLARFGFRDYLQAKIVENRQASNAIRKDFSLNARQINLLQHLAKDSNSGSDPGRQKLDLELRGASNMLCEAVQGALRRPRSLNDDRFQPSSCEPRLCRRAGRAGQRQALARPPRPLSRRRVPAGGGAMPPISCASTAAASKPSTRGPSSCRAGPSRSGPRRRPGRRSGSRSRRRASMT